MRYTRLSFALLLCSLAGLVSSASAADADTPVTITAESFNAAGWGAAGWGAVNLTFKNKTDASATWVFSEADWFVDGQRIDDAWDEREPNLEIPARGENHRTINGILPQTVADASASAAAKKADSIPHIRGSAIVRVSGKDYEIPIDVAIPVAKLPEPLKLRQAKYIGLNLLESRWKDWPAGEKALEQLDQAYQAMIELTGNIPFDGKPLIIQEAPAHPWWAYAGNPIIMGTNHMPQTVQEINAGILSFGWVHEFGHCFDTCGDWYIWDGGSCEFQANFKLAYAFETLPGANANRGRFTSGTYAFADKTANPKTDINPMPGRDFIDAYFGTWGDKYLGDPSRKWDSMNSDEIQTIMCRLTRVHGWGPFKKTYRTYARLDKAGLKKPETNEAKVQLLCAILSYHTGVDLVPSFKLWRFPVTEENVQAMMKQYPIAEKKDAGTLTHAE